MTIFQGKFSLAILCLCLPFSAGCGSDDSGTSAATPGQKIALVNIVEVAKEAKLTEQLQQIVSRQRNQMGQAINERKAAFETDLKKKETEYGDKPTEEQQAELQQLQAQIGAWEQRVTQQVNQQSLSIEQQFLSNLREQVRPIAIEIAKEQGYMLVLEKNLSVLAYSSTIDISSEVVTRLKEKELTNAADGGNQPSLPTGTTPPTGQNSDLQDLLTNPAGKTGKDSAPSPETEKPTPGEKDATTESDIKDASSESDSPKTPENKDKKPASSDDSKDNETSTPDSGVGESTKENTTTESKPENESEPSPEKE